MHFGFTWPTCYFLSTPVEVLLQQVQPLLHLSVGEVCVAVLSRWRLSTLGWLFCTLAGTLTHPLLCMELWRERRVQTDVNTHTQGKWSVLLEQRLGGSIFRCCAFSSFSFTKLWSAYRLLNPNISPTEGSTHLTLVNKSHPQWDLCSPSFGFLQVMAGD